jgi:type VI secretion system Hcp family effector
MPGNTFINFGKDVPDGESMQKDHPGTAGWIEISDWDFEITSESSAGKGQGSAVGKATTEGLNVSHYFDISSPTILSKIVTGTHFPTITIHMLKQTGEAGKAPQTYFEVKVAEAFVSKVSTKGSGDDGTMSQDEHRTAMDKVQKLTDDHIAEIDRMMAAKEAEILQV